jgi:hypothetical protein
LKAIVLLYQKIKTIFRYIYILASLLPVFYFFRATTFYSEPSATGKYLRQQRNGDLYWLFYLEFDLEFKIYRYILSIVALFLYYFCVINDKKHFRRVLQLSWGFFKFATILESYKDAVFKIKIKNAML